MSLHIGTWCWGSRYGREYVDRLESAVVRNYSHAFSFHCWAPEPEDRHLTEIPGCFARLRTFDPTWQLRNGIAHGDRIVVLDLDLIVTGRLDDGVFDRDEPFVIWKGANQSNPNPLNGSVWMLKAGYRPDVWLDFTVRAASALPFYAFPDDQNWFLHKFGPDCAGWQCGPESGIWSFAKRGWPKDNRLPEGAKIVAFPGSRDPSQFQHLDWVRQHWR